MRTRIHGFEMAYDDSGAIGTPLVLIHGYPLDRTLWLAQRDALADLARVILPDLRGFGESELPAGAVTVDTYADDLKALLDMRQVDKAIIGGMSMGGYIAFAFCRKYPERVRGLLLVDTRPQPDTAEGRKGREDGITLAQAKGAGAIAEQMLPKMLTGETLEKRPEVGNGLRGMMARQRVEAIVAALGALRDRPDSTPTLAALNVPTLIVVGAQDALTPPQDSEMMHRAIKGSEFATVPNAAHASNYEQPEEFNRILRDWLKANYTK